MRSAESFWRFIQEYLQFVDFTNIDLVNTKLVEFIKTVSDYRELYAAEDVDIYRCAQILIRSDIYEKNKVFCISKMLSCLNIDLLDLNFKLFVSYVLLLDCKNDLSLLQLIQEYQGFTVLYHNLHLNFETIALDENNNSLLLTTIKKLCTVQLDLLFQICKYLTLRTDELLLIDDFFINYIFESLMVEANGEDDIYNYSKFKLILAINEQYMIANTSTKLENKVFVAIATHTTFRNFSDCLLVHFNREEDICLKVLTSKILYLIFTNESTSDLFYNNDLNVLADVLIRELNDISEDEDSIRNTFLRVLYPLLNTKHFERTRYKKDELLKLLTYFAGQSENKFWNQTETTKRLALRCLSISWLSASDSTDNSNENSPSTSEPQTPSPTGLAHIHLTASNSSSSSINSMSKKSRPPLPPPPPPVPRKCLSRGGSSASVLNDRYR